MDRMEQFPLEQPELEERGKFYTKTFEKIQNIITPEHYAWEITEKQMDSFLNLDTSRYELMRLFFSSYTPRLVENYFKYILKEEVEIHNFMDAVNAYSEFQIQNGIAYSDTIWSILFANWVDFSSEWSFEKTLNRMMWNLRVENVVWEKMETNSYQNYRETIEDLAKTSYIPEWFNYETYKEYMDCNYFTDQDLVKLFEKDISPEFVKKVLKIWNIDTKWIIYIKEMVEKIWEEEAFYRLEKMSSMFEVNVWAYVRMEVISYPLATEFFEFLERNPQNLHIWNKEIEFSHTKWPINVFRWILKLAEEKGFESIDDMNAIFLIREYEWILNGFIEEWKNDYGKVFSLIQNDKSFVTSRQVENILRDNYWYNFSKVEDIYDSTHEFLNGLEYYLERNPDEKVLLYIWGHGWENGVTETNIWDLYWEDIDRLKELSIKYNLDVDFDSCMSGQKTEWPEWSVRGSSLYEDNWWGLVIKDLLTAFRGSEELTNSDIFEFEKIVGKKMVNSLKEKNFIWGIDKIEIVRSRLVLLTPEEKNAARKIIKYLKENNRKNWDFTWDWKVNWNEATLYKFLKSEYNIIPISYVNREKWEVINIS